MGALEQAHDLLLAKAEIVSYDVFPMTPCPVPRIESGSGKVNYYEYIENHRFMVAPKPEDDLTPSSIHDLNRWMNRLVPRGMVPDKRLFCYADEYTSMRMGHLIFSEQLGVVTVDGDRRIEQLVEEVPAEVLRHIPAQRYTKLYNRYITVLPFPHSALAREFATSYEVAMLEALCGLELDRTTQPG